MFLRCFSGTSSYWIGLHHQSITTVLGQNCTCSNQAQEQCDECRTQFLWVDGVEQGDFKAWANDDEPLLTKNCIYVEDQIWKSENCDAVQNYACYKGM